MGHVHETRFLITFCETCLTVWRYFCYADWLERVVRKPMLQMRNLRREFEEVSKLDYDNLKLEFLNRNLQRWTSNLSIYCCLFMEFILDEDLIYLNIPLMFPNIPIMFRYHLGPSFRKSMDSNQLYSINTCNSETKQKKWYYFEER